MGSPEIWPGHELGASHRLVWVRSPTHVKCAKRRDSATLREAERASRKKGTTGEK